MKALTWAQSLRVKSVFSRKWRDTMWAQDGHEMGTEAGGTREDLKPLDTENLGQRRVRKH
jgi:hypothetical protein